MTKILIGIAAVVLVVLGVGAYRWFASNYGYGE